MDQHTSEKRQIRYLYCISGVKKNTDACESTQAPVFFMFRNPKTGVLYIPDKDLNFFKVFLFLNTFGLAQMTDFTNIDRNLTI